MTNYSHILGIIFCGQVNDFHSLSFSIRSHPFSESENGTQYKVVSTVINKCNGASAKPYLFRLMQDRSL